MKATIKGVYTHKQDGTEYVTKKGNLYIKLLLSLENGDSLYESFFFTPRAHFRFEDLYASAGQQAPSATEITAANVNQLIGEEININVGKNKAGYDTVTKFYPKQVPVTAGAAADDGITDEISGQVADDDLDEEVPF